MHGLCLPTDDEPELRIAITPPGQQVKFFDTPELSSLLEALNHQDTFSYARECALNSIKNVVEYYEEEIWKPNGIDTFEGLVEMEEYRDIRREVWDLVRVCCAQEGNLLREARRALNAEISRST